LASTILLGLVVPILAHYILNKYGFWWLFNPNRPVSSIPSVAVPTKETTVV
jgi:hypothetical protein